MIASLPMYERKGETLWHDDLWSEIRDRLRATGIDAPDRLTRSGDPWSDWQSNDLLLSQTCGLPYRASLHKHLTLVGAPALWVPDTFEPEDATLASSRPTALPPGKYYSVIVARADDTRRDFLDFAGARLAYNDALSQSGWGLMHAHANKQGVTFGSGVLTGSHRASALAVVKGRADIAAIDVATWYGPLKNDRWTSYLKIVDRTALSPALPYVTAFPDLVAPLFDALKGAMAYPYKEKDDLPCLQDVLNIAPEGVVPADPQAYAAISLPPAPPAAP